MNPRNGRLPKNIRKILASEPLNQLKHCFPLKISLPGFQSMSRCPTMRCAGICACRQKQIWHISSVDLPQIWKNIYLACGIAGCKHGFCMFLSGECDTTSPKCRKNQMHSNTTSREWFWFLCVLFILNARITTVCSSLGFSPFGKE